MCDTLNLCNCFSSYRITFLTLFVIWMHLVGVGLLVKKRTVLKCVEAFAGFVILYMLYAAYGISELCSRRFTECFGVLKCPLIVVRSEVNIGSNT